MLTLAAIVLITVRMPPHPYQYDKALPLTITVSISDGKSKQKLSLPWTSNLDGYFATNKINPRTGIQGGSGWVIVLEDKTIITIFQCGVNLMAQVVKGDYYSFCGCSCNMYGQPKWGLNDITMEMIK